MMGRRPPWKVSPSATAVESLEQLATNALPNESGGLLIGWYDHNEIRVADALAVGDPQAGPASYVRTNAAGTATRQAFLSRKSPTDPSGYVGEWHSHPAPVGPSLLDKLTFITLAAQVDSPLAMIVLTRQHDSWEPIIEVVGRTRRRKNRKKGMA